MLPNGSSAAEKMQFLVGSFDDDIRTLDNLNIMRYCLRNAQ
jgi:hypothetical protein